MNENMGEKKEDADVYDCICPECGSIVFVTKSLDSEVEYWGPYAAKCIECGADYPYLSVDNDGVWTTGYQDGELRPAKGVG
jgi:hypothetical protein